LKTDQSNNLTENFNRKNQVTNNQHINESIVNNQTHNTPIPGMYAHPPTIAACKANLDLPELMDLPRDGEIVADNGQVRVQKAAIYYSWNIPRLSQRLDMSEDELRDALFKYSNNPDVKDPNKKVFIPAVGGEKNSIYGCVSDTGMSSLTIHCGCGR
jgi:hypothetical protein